MIHAFSDIEKAQPLCKRLQDSLESHLAKLREQNDKDRGEAETAALRGEIKAIKQLLADMSDKPTPQPAPRRNPYQ